MQSTVADASGGVGGGGGVGGVTMSPNTAYVSNITRRPSNRQLYDALSASEHGYGTPHGKGQGLGLGLTSGPLPALSFTLPKHDKLLTRSASISSSVLNSFDQVNDALFYTSTNNTPLSDPPLCNSTPSDFQKNINTPSDPPLCNSTPSYPPHIVTTHPLSDPSLV